MHTPQHLPTEEVFPCFEWKDGQQPAVLRLHPTRFLEDKSHNLYGVRKAPDVPLATVDPSQLYNGSEETAWDSTEGRGLYFTNTPLAAERILGIGKRLKLPNELYIGRITLQADEILDASTFAPDRTASQHAASLLLQARAILPGIPNPGRAAYDRLYGDAKVVTTRPLAMARALSGNSTLSTTIGKIPARWMIVRDLDLIDIVAKRSAATAE